MASVGEVLKSEILRLSKKAIRQHLGPVQSATNAQRKQLSALKKQVQQLERELAALRRSSRSASPAPTAEDGTSAFRFSAKGLGSLRSRLGLSAGEFGQLIDVSAQTIYNWESKKTVPRASQLPAIAGLRQIGKREARARLDAAQPGSATE